MEALTRMAQPDRTDLIASAAAGDEVAFRQIIAAHHDDMRRGFLGQDPLDQGDVPGCLGLSTGLGG